MHGAANDSIVDASQLPEITKVETWDAFEEVKKRVLAEVDVARNSMRLDQFLRTQISRLNTQAKEEKRSVEREQHLRELIRLLRGALDLPDQFFAIEGDQMIVIVFKLAFYHCPNVLGEAISLDKFSEAQK